MVDSKVYEEWIEKAQTDLRGLFLKYTYIRG